MAFVTGVLRNAKMKSASSGRFELDSSSSRPTSSAAFSFVSAVSHTLILFSPLLVRSITRCDYASEAVTSYRVVPAHRNRFFDPASEFSF